MRSIVTLSVPQEKLLKIKKIIASRNFKSISEYFVFAVEQEQNLISENDVIKKSKKAQEKYEKWECFSWLDRLKKMI